VTPRPAGRLALTLALACGPALAQDFVTTAGPLSDADFYRLVACAAPPGGDCAKPMLHWPTDAPVTVGIARIDPAFLGGKQARARAALTRAVQYLNDCGMGLRLAEAEGDTMIRLRLIDSDGAEPLADTGSQALDGTTLRGARVVVQARGGVIRSAEIAIGTRLHISHYESALIEELAQALGLLTDIRNPDYEGVSIFSEDSNAAKKPGRQDIMALSRHYPPEG
jgi:hypothetical protein